MDGHDDHNMSLDAPAAGDVATQETQSRNQQIPSDTHLWGYLQPCRPEVPRIDFWKMQQTYNLGRNPANDIVLSGVKVSAYQILLWNYEYTLISLRFICATQAISTVQSLGMAQKNTRMSP